TSQNTLGRLLSKSSNAFYARRLHTKSSRSLLPKVHLNVFEFAVFSDMRQTLKDFLENSQNTLGKSSKDFFARRLSMKSSHEVSRKSSEIFYFSDLNHTLKNFSEDSRKTS
ncbi:hypothetical protein IGI04_025929, partial [Brassica rapa subsp. trilocularis]